MYLCLSPSTSAERSRRNEKKPCYNCYTVKAHRLVDAVAPSARASFSNHHLHRRFENGTVRLVHKSAHGQADAQMPSTPQLTWPCSSAVCCAAPLLAHSSNASLPPSCSFSGLRFASVSARRPSVVPVSASVSLAPVSVPSVPPPPLPSWFATLLFCSPPTSLRSSGERYAAGAGPSRWRVAGDAGAAPVRHQTECRAAGCSVCVKSRCDRALLLLCCLSVSFCPPLPSGVRRCLLVGALWRDPVSGAVQAFRDHLSKHISRSMTQPDRLSCLYQNQSPTRRRQDAE